MRFISKILKESKENYRKKFIKKKLNSFANVSKKFVTLNGNEINLKFIKISKNFEKDQNLKCSVFEDFKVCYLMTWVNEFDTYDFIEQVDLVICDLEWKVIKVYRSLPVDSKIQFNKNCHIYIMAHNSIEYHEIETDNYLRPF